MLFLNQRSGGVRRATRGKDDGSNVFGRRNTMLNQENTPSPSYDDVDDVDSVFGDDNESQVSLDSHVTDWPASNSSEPPSTIIGGASTAKGGGALKRQDSATFPEKPEILLPEPLHDIGSVPFGAPNLEGSRAIYTDSKEKWIEAVGEMGQVATEAAFRRHRKMIDKGQITSWHSGDMVPLRASYMYRRLKYEDEKTIGGWMIRDDATGALQGFLVYCNLRVHAPLIEFSHSKAQKHYVGSHMTRMNQLPREGCPFENGVTVTKVIELMMLGGLRCGQQLLRILKEHLMTKFQDYVFLVATEQAESYYKKVGFERVYCKARYLTANIQLKYGKTKIPKTNFFRIWDTCWRCIVALKKIGVPKIDRFTKPFIEQKFKHFAQMKRYIEKQIEKDDLTPEMDARVRKVLSSVDCAGDAIIDPTADQFMSTAIRCLPRYAPLERFDRDHPELESGQSTRFMFTPIANAAWAHSTRHNFPCLPAGKLPKYFRPGSDCLVRDELVSSVVKHKNHGDQYFFVLEYYFEIHWCHIVPLCKSGKKFGEIYGSIKNQPVWTQVQMGSARELEVSADNLTLVKEAVCIVQDDDTSKEEWFICKPGEKITWASQRMDTLPENLGSQSSITKPDKKKPTPKKATKRKMSVTPATPSSAQTDDKKLKLQRTGSSVSETGRSGVLKLKTYPQRDRAPSRAAMEGSSDF